MIPSHKREIQLISENAKIDHKIVCSNLDPVDTLNDALTRFGSNLKNDSQNFIYKGQAIPEDYLIGNIGDGVSTLVIEICEAGSAFSRLQNVKILQRNVDECTITTAVIGNPSERERFVDAISPTALNPTTSDLADQIEKTGISFNAVAKNLKKFAEVLHLDEKSTNTNEVEIQRRIIQNNLDTVRYAGPLLVNLSKIVVPVGDRNGRLRSVE